MKHILLPLLACLLAANVAAGKKEHVVPDSFLKTTIPGWKRILLKPVSARFKAMPLREALFLVLHNSDANFTSHLGERKILITRNLDNVPLRTALYLLARDAGAKVTWEQMPDGFVRGIIFSTE